MSPTPVRKKFFIILNRESGTISRLGPDNVEAGLREVYAELGCGVEIRNVPGKEIPAALEAGRDSGADAVIVGGGDGTVASAAELLSAGADHPMPLGILPLGTFNLAARDVGMPLDWKEAARALATAPQGEMDLLELEGKRYLCVIVLGFYPALAMGQPEYHGSWIVKTVRTMATAFRSAATFPPLSLQLKGEGKVRAFRTRMAVLANNDYEDLFGLIPRRKSLDAGHFTAYISRHTSRWGMFRSAVGWILGRWKEDREISVIHASELEINVRRKKSLPVMTDGELHKMKLPIRVKLIPKAITVIAPRLDEPGPEAAAVPATEA